MIKVLIVDDDNLVRKGLMSMLPWKGYSMEVVGEAKNGEKALEFLEGTRWTYCLPIWPCLSCRVWS